MRLIDADKLSEALLELMGEASVFIFPTLQSLYNRVKDIPTAYDKDKVIQQCRKAICNEGHPSDECCDINYPEICKTCYADVFDIIEKCGIDED